MNTSLLLIRIRQIRLLFGLFLLLLLLVPSSKARAEENASLPIQMTYGQSEARSMLKLINQFRQGKEAWAWDEEGQTKVYYSDLPPLHYDYALEKAAMIRAAEIAFVFSHTRPTGEGCFTVGGIGTPQSIYGTSAGENIGTGYGTAQEVLEAWKETEEDYEGQAHRRTMLTAQYTAVGIGHVIYHGTHYWVQQYGTLAETTPTPSVNGIGEVDLTVPASWITSLDLSLEGGEKAHSLPFGEKAKLPRAVGFVTLGKDHVFALRPQYAWVSADPDTATAVSGWVYAHRAGDAALSLTIAGQTLTFDVHIRPADISSFTLLVTDGENPQEPDVFVKKGELTLEEGTDYLLTYTRGYRPSYLTITVQGTGNYAGTLQTIYVLPARAREDSSLLLPEEIQQEPEKTGDAH